MSISKSIALDGPISVKRFGPARMLLIAAGLVLAAAVGYAINSPETKQLSVARVVSQAQTADFLYWNTTALERAVPAASVVGSTVDPFIEANTTALERLAPEVGHSSTRGDAFISANTTGLEYPAATYTERWNGPR